MQSKKSTPQIEFDPVRHWNLRAIIKACGGNNAAAAIMGTSPSNLSQYGRKNPGRNIADDFAANVEKAFGLPPGALDNPIPKEVGDASLREINSRDKYLSQLIETLANASDDDKAFVLNTAQWIVHRSLNKNKPNNDGAPIIIKADDV